MSTEKKPNICMFSGKFTGSVRTAPICTAHRTGSCKICRDGNTGAPAGQSADVPRRYERVEIFEMAGGDMIIEFRQTETGQSVVTFKEITDVP